MHLYKNAGAMPPEDVVPFNDPVTGICGVIVLHSTSLGPAAGGCRFTKYATDEGAMTDALRLAEGMTMKNALADLPLGGGKAVLRLPPNPFDRPALFKAVGRAVAALGGRYVTAEDLGTSVEDMTYVATSTRHVAGLAAKPGQPGGDPSHWTALGVATAMQVAVQRHLGRDMADVTVAVQGLGNVGMTLCKLLHEAGARLIVAEPRSDVAARAAVAYDAQVMSSSALMQAKADVFAPCALGGVLDFVSVNTLGAKVVCGAANNQLLSDDQAAQLAGRGILYAPDYLVNAGGIISVAAEYLGWSECEVARRVALIGPRLATMIDSAEATGLTPLDKARRASLHRIAHPDLSLACVA